MSTSADPAASTTMSSIAARRQHTSLPSFHLPPTSHRVFNPLGPMLTPPAISSHDSSNSMGSSINNNTSSTFSSPSYWPSTTQTSSSYPYGSASASSSSFSAPSNMAQSTSAGYRNLYSPSGPSSVNRGNSRPNSPSTSMPTSQSYEPPSHYSGSVGLPPMSQSGLSQQYSSSYPVSTASSHATSSDLYPTHSSLPPLSQSHGYYQQSSSYGGSSLSSSLMSLSSNQPHSFSRTLMPSNSASSAYPPLAPSGRGYLNHMSGLPMPYHVVHPGMPQQERPFKCDQCPQSFNRNHDLKRHKRIHLAVKPFPCDCCEKSFSRKDALKRHRLVKGCGKGDKTATRASASPTTSRRPMSPHTPNEESMPRHFSRSPTGVMMDRHL
jgi:uncharacterized Zn-finger protein